MKVAYILQDISMSGSVLSFFNMLDELIPKGVKPIIITSGKCFDPLFSKKIAERDIKVYHVNFPKAVYFLKWYGILNSLKYYFHLFLYPFESFVSVFEIKEILKKEEVDIVHTNVGTVRAGFFAAQKMNIPHVWHLREYQDKDFNYHFLPTKKYFRKLLYKSNVVTISKDIFRHFELECKKNAVIIYNGILSKNNIRFVEKKKKYFLIANRIAPSKGIEVAIDAFFKFHTTHPDYKLLIAGALGRSLDYEEQLIQFAKEKCDSSIVFMGYQKNVLDLMTEAKALIVASRSEGFGRMTAEAAFCGCPVIGNNSGGTKEILEETGGFLFEGTSGDLAQKMEQVTSLSDQEYLLIAKKAQEKAIELYSCESNGNNIYGFYKEIINNNRITDEKS